MLRERIRKRLEQSFDYFYSDQDREQGTFRNKQLGCSDQRTGAFMRCKPAMTI